jgi:hypothetical protein
LAVKVRLVAEDTLLEEEPAASVGEALEPAVVESAVLVVALEAVEVLAVAGRRPKAEVASPWSSVFAAAKMRGD